MKKINRILITMAVSLVFIMCTALCASAEDSDNPLNCQMSKCTSTSMTFTWNSMPSYQGHEIDQWVLLAYAVDPDTFDIDQFNPEKYDGIGIATGKDKTSCTIPNVKKGKLYLVSLVPIYADDGFDNDEMVCFTEGNTTPSTISKSNVGLDSIRNSGSYYYLKFAVKKPSYATKVQLKVYNISTGKVVATKYLSKTSSEIKFSKNKAYKYRMRAYYDNETNGERYYGSWSSYRYFDNPKATYSTSSKKKGCKVKLTGISNISKYKIYVSTSSTKKGSLTKTATPKKGKTVTYSITKKGSSSMKKGTKYYVTVIPYVKNGSSTYESDVVAHFNFKSPR